MKTAACVTPPGRSAIATIRVTGFDSLTEFDSLFVPAGKRQLDECRHGRVVFGEWTNLLGSKEELVVTVLADNEIEVHCHGGTAAISAVLESLASIGFETHRFDCRRHEQIDSPQQSSEFSEELNFGLLNAPTRKIADFFLSATGPSAEAGTPYDRKIDELIAGMDASVDQTISALEEWKSTFFRGQFLVRPIRIILAGPPNVGKSSLNNRMLGYSRSIIFDQPGTTRDVVSEKTTIDGWHFELSDTAGLRESGDSIEQAGVDRAKEKIRQADLVVWIQSAENANSNVFQAHEEADLLTEIKQLDGESRPRLKVLNKLDQVSSSRVDELSKSLPDVLLTSAITGQGVEELMQRIKNLTVDPEPKPGQPVLFTRRQYALVDKCICQLKSQRLDEAKSTLMQLGTRT